jgi:hypothetical protein
MLIRFLAFFFTFQGSVWALDCREAQAPSEVSSSVQQMLKQASSFRSVEDFIIGLPDEMKSNFTMLADSRSFHASSLENPRVVLSSNDGRVRVTYSTLPNARGSNAVEISIWNPKTMTFDYKEIKAKSPTTPLVAEQSPIACANCHGNPPKPNLEAPDRVPGAIPFARETVVSDSPESQWYKSYLERMEERSPENFRFNVLRPDVSLEQYREREASGPTIQVSALAQPSRPERYYQQSAELMRCFQANRLRQRANYDGLKYLLAGLKLGCNPASFMQDWNFQAAQNYFQGRLPQLSIPQGPRVEQFNALRNQLTQNTLERQVAGQRRAEGRQKAFWLQSYLNPSQVDVDMQKNSTLIASSPKKAQSEAQGVADLRLLLEPLGVQVSRFSLSRDPFDYNFGGSFESDYILDSDLEAIMQENTESAPACDFLAEKNRTALEQLRPKAEQFSLNICQQRQKIEDRIHVLASGGFSITRSLIRQEAAKIMADKCLACHQSVSSSGTNIGSMAIPFDNIDKVSDLLTSDFGRLNELKDIMRDRINRPHGHQGAMPVSFVTDMSADEKAYLSLWLDFVGVVP